jgi:PTS system arbutin/cellobiose/salicin-specific IIC component
MSKNYAAVSRSIVDAVGGASNVAAVTHCMTRLRFVLNDDTLVDAARLKAIGGVLGVVRSEISVR